MFHAEIERGSVSQEASRARTAKLPSGGGLTVNGYTERA